MVVEGRWQVEQTREGWLKAGAAETAKILSESTGIVVPGSYVSVGFPKGRSVARRQGGRSRRILGQCWNGALSKDGTAHIFVCPTQEDAAGVLDVLLHEQIHATVGTEQGHRGAFARTARAVGYQKPWATPTAGPELLRRLDETHGCLLQPRTTPEDHVQQARRWAGRGRFWTDTQIEAGQKWTSASAHRHASRGCSATCRHSGTWPTACSAMATRREEDADGRS